MPPPIRLFRSLPAVYNHPRGERGSSFDWLLCLVEISNAFVLLTLFTRRHSMALLVPFPTGGVLIPISTVTD